MPGFRAPDLDGMSVDEMIDSVRVWYHTLELGERTTPGHYDMAAVVDHYRIPEDLSGLQVIDVGASNGFFSFLFERRGAKRVVATELAEFKNHDYPRWFLERELQRRSADEIAEIDWHELHGGFTVAHKILGSRVERVMTRVYDLPDSCPDRFDLAFCSNVFVHLQNPVAAMEAIREMLRPGGRAIFATPVDTSYEDVSAAVFVGRPELCAWWVPTQPALARMCEAAGFADVQSIGTFELARVRGEPIVDRIGVVHCARPVGGIA